MDNNVQLTILALVAVAALALVLQTIFLIVILAMARKAMTSLREELEQYRSSVMPVIVKTRELVQNIAPKIEDAAGELAEITRSLRAQTADIQRAADEIIARTQRQAGRVDGMLTTVFDSVERAGTFMSDAVSKPMRQLSGVIASVKAVVDTLRAAEVPHRHETVYRYPDGEGRAAGTRMPGPDSYR
jgi:uncharacterized protein YoxC